MTNRFDRSLTSPDIVACPFATYRTLQCEAPVYRDPVTGWYEVTRFEDLRRIAADPARFSSASPAFAAGSASDPEITRMYEEDGFPPIPTLLTNDPPNHRKFRSLVDKAFGLKRVLETEAFIEALVENLIDRMAPAGRAEFVAEFAIPLPVTVIAHMLGVPEDRLGDFKRWSDALMLSSDITTSIERKRELTREIVTMQQFFKHTILQEQERPSGSLISALVEAQIDGEKLTQQELTHTLQSLLVAGNETTTNALANALRMMIERPGLEQRLRADPELIPAFLEETLRLEAPLQALFRRASEDVVVGDVTIPKDSTIVMRWGAAGRDPSQFEQPETLILERQNIAQHLTFGFGIHYCLGNQLARAELRIAFGKLLARLRDFQLAAVDNPAVYEPSFIAYGPTRLEIEFATNG